MFPTKGTKWSSLEQTLREFKRHDFDWRRGRVPGLVHHHSDEVHHVVEQAYCMYMPENALGAGKAFPSLAALEQEIESMVLDLFHAPPCAGATITSGGTESILLAVKAARDRAACERGSSRPNIVAGLTAHPALNKAGELFGIEVRRVPLAPDLRTDVDALTAAVDTQTVMLYSSAPCYPYGVFDDIAVIGAFAERKGLWLHVDACWGGFISPFALDLGYAIPPFDFNVPGVTTLSADLHKFGFAAKGCSVLGFRERSLQRHAKFQYRWIRGVYETPSLAGSRPAGTLAAAWAVMRYLGKEGYREAVRCSMDTTVRLRDAIGRMPGLLVQPAFLESNLFIYSSTNPHLDIDAVATALKNRGWYPGRIEQPRGIHHAVAPVHAVMVDDYITDLAGILAEVREKQLRGSFDAHSY